VHRLRNRGKDVEGNCRGFIVSDAVAGEPRKTSVSGPECKSKISRVQSCSAKQSSLSFASSDCINARQWMICFASTVLYTVHCLETD